MRQVSLRLIVVIIAYIILYGILREKALHLLVELSRQRLVVTEDQGGTIGLCDDIRHRERLTRARHTQQHLCMIAPTQALSELPDGLGLVARRLVF